MKKSLFISFFYFAFLPLITQAEYRAYQYLVKTNELNGKNTKSYIVTSSLPTWSYLAYHGGPSSIILEQVNTWMCKGKTGPAVGICPSPEILLNRDILAEIVP